MTAYFTADLHLSHANIIKYCNRPFLDKDEMNEALIANWNRKVSDKDEIYVIGDFAFDTNPEKFLDRLNGKKFLIAGNHDSKATRNCRGWEKVWNFGNEINVHNQSIVLCHYAMRVWNKSHRGSWHLYGHSHGSLPDDPNLLSFDVGVDSHNYAPISFCEVKDIMEKKTWFPPKY